MILVKLGCRLFSVLTVTPSKIKIETIQYRRSRILEMKDDKYEYEKSLAKRQVCAIFHEIDATYSVLRKMFCPKFKALHGDAMLVSLGGAQKLIGRFYKSKNSLLQGLKHIKVVFYFETRNVQIGKSQKVDDAFSRCSTVYIKENLKKLMMFLAYVVKSRHN